MKCKRSFSFLWGKWMWGKDTNLLENSRVGRKDKDLRSAGTKLWLGDYWKGKYWRKIGKIGLKNREEGWAQTKKKERKEKIEKGYSRRKRRKRKRMKKVNGLWERMFELLENQACDFGEDLERDWSGNRNKCKVDEAWKCFWYGFYFFVRRREERRAWNGFFF